MWRKRKWIMGEVVDQQGESLDGCPRRAAVWQMFCNPMGAERQRSGVEPGPPTLCRGILERRGHRVRGRGCISVLVPRLPHPWSEGSGGRLSHLNQNCLLWRLLSRSGDWYSVSMGIALAPGPPQIPGPFYKMAKYLQRICLIPLHTTCHLWVI